MTESATLKNNYFIFNLRRVILNSSHTSTVPSHGGTKSRRYKKNPVSKLVERHHIGSLAFAFKK